MTCSRRNPFFDQCRAKKKVKVFICTSIEDYNTDDSHPNSPIQKGTNQSLFIMITTIVHHEYYYTQTKGLECF